MESTGPNDVSSTAWHQGVLSRDVDEFGGVQPNWTLHYTQLSRGPFLGQIRFVQLPGMRLVRESSTRAIWQRGELGRGCIGLAMPQALSGHGAFNGQTLGPDSIMIGRSEELSLCLPADFELIGIVVDAELLGSLWEQLYHKRMSSWIDHQVVVEPRSGLADIVRSVHLRVMADVEAMPQLLRDAVVVRHLRDAVLIEWVEALPTRITSEGLGSGETRKRVVDRACELMAACQQDPPTILQVCQEVGASPSKLEHCFRSVLGIAPAKYMRAARLQGVRRDLRLGTARSVQDVAAHWGFWHMGEFAAAYRLQFGELPSQTLRGLG